MEPTERNDLTRTRTAAEWFGALDYKEPVHEYNFEHFRTKHLVKDAQRTMQEWGIRPGELAPDFELPRVEGGALRLCDQPRPILLRFGSIT
jgi:hypothetical protein